MTGNSVNVGLDCHLFSGIEMSTFRRKHPAATGGWVSTCATGEKPEEGTWGEPGRRTSGIVDRPRSRPAGERFHRRRRAG